MVNFSKLISTGIPALILLYVFYLIAFNVPVIYTIDIGSEGDVDPGKDAYLRNMTSQARLTRSMSIEGDTFRNMTGPPLYFYITPGNSITNDTKITAELKFRGDSDLDISLYPEFAWMPLYIKKFDNYSLVMTFCDVSIYSINNSSKYTNYGTIEEWISGNIPKNSTIGLYDTSPSILINKDLTYNNVKLEINQTFRGTHSFLVYLKDNLNLTLDKQDQNGYNGTDEYSVELYDMEGNMRFNDTFPDDGIIDNSKQKVPQYRTFFYDGIKEGVYELRLVNLKGGNRAADSTITGIRINTDKLTSQGNILPLDLGTLYLKLRSSTELKFRAQEAQYISFSGPVNMDVRLNRTTWTPVELPEGSYTMSIKGNLIISGANIAFSVSILFQPYNYEINNENSEWLIASNYHVETDSNGWISSKKNFKGSDLKLNNDKTIVFGLRNKTKSEVMLNEFKVTISPR